MRVSLEQVVWAIGVRNGHDSVSPRKRQGQRYCLENAMSSFRGFFFEEYENNNQHHSVCHPERSDGSREHKRKGVVG